MKILLPLILSLSLLGCSDNRTDSKELKFVGSGRKITLYDANGRVIREWHTKGYVEARDGACKFVDDKQAVIVCGTFAVEEEK